MGKWGRNLVGVALAIVILTVGDPSLAAEPKQFAVGLGVDFATGDYGTGTTTDSFRVPLTIDYFPTERLDFELVVPYVHQSSSQTILVGGTRFQTGRHGRTFAGDMQNTVASQSTQDSQSGLGDITLVAGYLLLHERPNLPAVRPLVYLKFPTAEEDKGLGTGEFDLGAGLSAAKWFGRWSAYAEGRYVFQGSNADLGLKDYATVEVEAGCRLTERFFPSISAWWSSAPADDSSDPLELRLEGKYRVTDAVSVEGFAGTGLSSATADFSAGLAVFYSF